MNINFLINFDLHKEVLRSMGVQYVRNFEVGQRRAIGVSRLDRYHLINDV